MQNGNRNVLDYYDIKEQLGSGAFSDVKLAVEKNTGKRVAMKIIDKSKCVGKEHMIQSEVDILKKVKHNNIISLLEMFESPQKIYLAMELVNGGELFDSIVERGHYTEKETAKLVFSILDAVDYLHDMGIAHRDLKPENLMYSDRSKQARIMLGDFGLSKLFNDEEVMKTACGTPGYVAPEVLKREGYSRAVDLWSIGVITYILLCGYPPFYEENNAALFQTIMRGDYEFDSPYWDDISKDAKHFISQLLLVNVKKRIDAKAALDHPFITKYCKREKKSTIASDTSLSAVSAVGSSTGSVDKNNDPFHSNEILDEEMAKEMNRINTAIGPMERQVTAIHQDPEAKGKVSGEGITTDFANQSGVLINNSQSQAVKLTQGGKQDSYLDGPGYNGGNVRILSMNLCLRPPLIKNTNSKSDYKDIRLQHFCDTQLQHYDVIAFQQVYAYGSSRQKKLLSQAKKKGYNYYLRSPSRGLLKGVVDGGLLIISRYPIIGHARMTATKGVSSDKNIAKGAIYAKIALNEKQHFHLVNTNLQHSPVAINDKLDDPTADIRRQQISQLRDFMYANIDAKEEVRDALSDCYGPVLLVGSFNVNGRASRNNGKSHSNEYDKLIQQINNSPKHFFSETGGRAQPKWRFRDVFYEKYQEHPVTLGDDEDLKDSTDPNQKPSWRSDPTLVACLPETMLTDKALIGSCQCLDYMFWSNARYPQPTERRQLHVNFKESSIEQLHVNIEKQVTQLSDHYGLRTVISLQSV